MSLLFWGIIIFVIIYLFLNWFARASSKKIATTIKKIVVYFFPYADTPGWTKEACGFRNIYEEFEKNNIKVIGISYNSSDALKKFKEKYNLPFSFLSDSKKEVAKSFGANGLFTPKRMTFVINENGKIEKIYKKVNINTHAETILKDLTS